MIQWINLASSQTEQRKGSGHRAESGGEEKKRAKGRGRRGRKDKRLKSKVKRQKDKKNKKEMFETHSLKLAKSMQLYMFSDGYVDQNGGDDNTEMKSQDFYDLLFKNTSKSFKDQKDQLISFYNNWKAENEQVDDVLVLGVKI